MQTVLLFLAKAATVGKAVVATAGHAAVAAGKTVANAAAAGGKVIASTGHAAAASSGMGTANAAVGTASKILNGLRIGTSVVSSLSSFAMASSQAAAAEAEANDEQMAASQEYVQAQQRVNLIDAEYNKVAGEQLAVASASGIDIGSGSVVEARRQARIDADREIDITRNGANMNAALRRARASTLRAGASATRFAALGQSVAKVGADYLDRKRVG